jgi:hypothetical protein
MMPVQAVARTALGKGIPVPSNITDRPASGSRVRGGTTPRSPWARALGALISSTVIRTITSARRQSSTTLSNLNVAKLPIGE